MAELTLVRWRRSLVIGLCCLLLFVGCSLNKSASVAGKTLTFATEPAFPPFEFQAQGGGLQGFDIDLTNAIAKSSGFTVKFQSLPFDGIIPGLRAKTVDAAISAITITSERAKTISFSQPYFKAGLAIATRTDNPSITGFDSLKNKTIAVQIGTTGATKAKSILGAKIRT